MLPLGAAFDAAIPQQIEKSILDSNLTTICDTLLVLLKCQTISENEIDEVKEMILVLFNLFNEHVCPQIIPISKNAEKICYWVINTFEYGFVDSSNSKWIMLEDLVSKFGFSLDEVIDVTDELKSLGYAKSSAMYSNDDSIMITNKIFWDFDKEMGQNYDTIINARSIASELVKSEHDFMTTDEILDILKLSLRQINPALTYLVENGIVKGGSSCNESIPYGIIYSTYITRKFIK